MTHFILIIMLFWREGPAVSQQEYNSEKACMFAKQAVENGWGYGSAICVPKEK